MSAHDDVLERINRRASPTESRETRDIVERLGRMAALYANEEAALLEEAAAEITRLREQNERLMSRGILDMQDEIARLRTEGERVEGWADRYAHPALKRLSRYTFDSRGPSPSTAQRATLILHPTGDSK